MDLLKTLRVIFWGSITAVFVGMFLNSEPIIMTSLVSMVASGLTPVQLFKKKVKRMRKSKPYFEDVNTYRKGDIVSKMSFNDFDVMILDKTTLPDRQAIHVYWIPLSDLKRPNYDGRFHLTLFSHHPLWESVYKQDTYLYVGKCEEFISCAVICNT